MHAAQRAGYCLWLLLSLGGWACASERGRSGASPDEPRAIAGPYAHLHDQVRFDRYPLLPVGAYRRQRGLDFPYIDYNRNGRFDPGEVHGRCDVAQTRCELHRAQLRVLQLSLYGDKPPKQGMLVTGALYGPRGEELRPVSLCQRAGRCAQPVQLPFVGRREMQDGIWTCGPPRAEGPMAFDLRTEQTAESFGNIEVRPGVALAVNTRTLGGDLLVTATATERIDLAAVTVWAGGRIRWASPADEESVTVQRQTLSVRVPASAVAGCAGACTLLLQLVRVWRDDAVLQASEARYQKVLKL